MKFGVPILLSDSHNITDTASRGAEPLLIVHCVKSIGSHLCPSLHNLVTYGPNRNDEWISAQRNMAMLETGAFDHKKTSKISSQAENYKKSPWYTYKTHNLPGSTVKEVFCAITMLS